MSTSETNGKAIGGEFRIDPQEPELPRYRFSTLPSITSVTPKSHHFTWARLTRVLQSKVFKRAEKKSIPVWSPASFKAGTTRKSANVDSIAFLVFDFDNQHISQDRAVIGHEGGQQPPSEPTATLPEISSLFRAKQVSAVLHTTYSHSDWHPKLRVIAPLAAPATPKDWPETVAWAIRHLGLDRYVHTLDLKATLDVARIFFWPAHPEGGKVEFEEVEGFPLEIPHGELCNRLSSTKNEVQPKDTSWLRQYKGNLRTLDLPAALEQLGCVVGPINGDRGHRRVTCPFDEDHTHPGGLDAWIVHDPGKFPWFACAHTSCEGRRLQQVLALLNPGDVDGLCQEPYKAVEPPKRKSILITTDQHRVVDQSLDALAESGLVYMRGDTLVHLPGVNPDALAEPGGHLPKIQPLEKPRIREILSRILEFQDLKGDELGPTYPPNWVADMVAARGHWRMLPVLTGVRSTPIFLNDGSILQTPGYHTASGYFYAPDLPYEPIKSEPSHADAQDAAMELREIVTDFPLATDTDWAAYLAAMLTPFGRPAFEGPSPLMLITGNIRGAGKTLLADTLGLVLQGRDLPKMAQPKNEEEEEKRITGVAVEGTPVVLVDNVSGPLGSPALCAAMTSTLWKARILGKTGNPEIPLDALWVATGNHVELAADMARRTITIQLRSQEENPECRKDFKHPYLKAWVKQERPRLVKAALTILRAFHCAGRPDMGLVPMGSFEGWSMLIRSAVYWTVGIDPCANRGRLASTIDAEHENLKALVQGWLDLFPEGGAHLASEVISKLTSEPVNHGGMKEAIDYLTAAARPGDGLNTLRFGKLLSKYRERVISGHQFVGLGAGKHGRAWSLVPIQQGTPTPPAPLKTQEGAPEAIGQPLSLPTVALESFPEDDEVVSPSEMARLLGARLREDPETEF